MVAIANTVIGLWMVSGIGALLTLAQHFLLAKGDVLSLTYPFSYTILVLLMRGDTPHLDSPYLVWL